MTIHTNISQVAQKIKTALQKLQDKDALLRTIATSILPVVHDRIHVQGKAADGSQIGTYQPSYLLLREKKYHRTGDATVILSLTRQMENDFSVKIDSSGAYGLGYNNSINYQKMRWMEEKFDKPIASLMDTEMVVVNDVSKQYVTDALSALS